VSPKPIAFKTKSTEETIASRSRHLNHHQFEPPAPFPSPLTFFRVGENGTYLEKKLIFAFENKMVFNMDQIAVK
jgi:hypothetical protein